MYIFYLKTRRHRNLILLFQSPVYFTFLLLKLIHDAFPLSQYQTFNYIQELSEYYLNLNLWFYYKHLYNRQNGILSNNLTHSCNFWTIYNPLKHLRVTKATKWLHVSKSRPILYFTPVRILSISVQTKSLYKLVWIVLLILIKLYTPNLDYINISYAYTYFFTNFHFFCFLNAFYFRLYTY